MYGQVKKKVKNKIIVPTVNWFSGKIYKPRLWTDQEWHKLTPKEKCWIWYKHHFHMIGIGNGELDNVLFFLRGEFITQASITVLLVKSFGLPDWCYLVYPVFFFAYKYVQWWIGNQIDARDLIALDKEIENKRNFVFREIRDRAKTEPFRKNL